MKNMYGESFPSLAHRLIYSYLIQAPEPPNPECGVDEEAQMQYQAMYTVRVSDFQTVFAEFSSMSYGLKQLIMDKASRCSGCRYCVQTDKSGTKPLAVSHVSYNGNDKAICSYYPFWSLHEVGSDRSDQLIELMSIAERVLAQNTETISPVPEYERLHLGVI